MVKDVKIRSSKFSKYLIEEDAVNCELREFFIYLVITVIIYLLLFFYLFFYLFHILNICNECKLRTDLLEESI